MTRVLLVEDERIATELFTGYIAAAPDRYRLAGTVRSAANAMVYCLSAPVDLVLMDICTADNESGITACAEIKNASRASRS